MRKMILIPVIFAALLLGTVSSAGAEINIFGGVGFAFSDIEGLLVDLGAELQLTKGFYMQFEVDTHIGDQGGNNYYYLNDGYIGSPMRVGTQPYGVSLFGVYKVPVSRNMKIFGKVGLHAAFHLGNVYREDYGYYDYYGNYEYTYYDDSGPRKSGLGTGFGIGIEQRLTDKLALVLGGTYKILFDEGTRYAPEKGNSQWYKMYVAFKYRVK